MTSMISATNNEGLEIASGTQLALWGENSLLYWSTGFLEMVYRQNDWRLHTKLHTLYWKIKTFQMIVGTIMESILRYITRNPEGIILGANDMNLRIFSCHHIETDKFYENQHWTNIVSRLMMKFCPEQANKKCF